VRSDVVVIAGISLQNSAKVRLTQDRDMIDALAPDRSNQPFLPIGQNLWLKELETYKEFPPLQDPASYKLDQVMDQLKKATHPSE